MAVGPEQLASGAPMPPPSGNPGQSPVTSVPGQAQVGTDITKVINVLGMAIQQAVDEQGFVDVQQLVAIWPQVAQQGGVNIPFQTVMQLIQQNPNLVSDLIVRNGLAGITMNGRRISAEQLAGIGTGAVGGGMA